MQVGELKEFNRRLTKEIESLKIFRLMMKKSGGVQLNEMGQEFIIRAIERGHSQAAVARLLNVNPSIISRYLKQRFLESQLSR